MERSAVELGDRVGTELPDHDVPRDPLDEGDNAGPTRTDDSVDLPVADMSSALDSGWSLGDVTFAGEPSSGIVRAVAFPTPLSGLAKELVASAPAALVVPDVAVDGLVADAETPDPLEPPRDLLGAPLLLEEGEDQGPVIGDESLIATGAGASPAGEVIGRGGTVGTVAAHVAVELPDNRATVASQGSSDLCGPKSLSPERGKLIPLSRGELAVRLHESLPVLAGSGRL